MSTHASVTKATALGATGIKTLIDTLTVPGGGVSKIVGVWSSNMGGATMTTGQPITGIVELESQDTSVLPLQLPLDSVSILTSGAQSLSPRIVPVNIPVAAGNRIACYITLDLTNTAALTGRVGVIYE